MKPNDLCQQTTKNTPCKEAVLLSLVRIVSDLLCEIRAVDTKSLQILNDVQNTMDVVEKLVSSDNTYG